MGNRSKASETASSSVARLWILSVLAAFAAGWSAFLWKELVQARSSGGDPFCAFGDAGACGALWDAPFAATIHRITGVPVAGWGVVWGLAAMALPLLLLLGKPAKGQAQKEQAQKERVAERRLGAVRLLALLALLALVVLLGASFAAGIFCSSCAIVYVVAGLYGIVGLGLDGPGTVDSNKAEARKAPLGAGVATVAIALLAAFLLMLYPGLKTPRGQAEAERQAVAKAIEGNAGGNAGGNTERPAAASQRDDEEGMPAWLTTGQGTGDPERDRQLQQFIVSLAPNMRQGLADSLWAYANAKALPAEEPRLVEGPESAPVRIVEFTDTLCSHCASLHETFEYLHTVIDDGTFSVERRHYPLDGNCNAEIPARGPETVRCLAARVKICLEGEEGYDEVTTALYRDQLSLTPEMVWETAEPYMAKQQLETCVASAATQEKLAADVAYAARFHPRGTPLVLVNGREGTSFAPFLYAMALTEGSFVHPAFAALPKPRPQPAL